MPRGKRSIPKRSISKRIKLKQIKKLSKPSKKINILANKKMSQKKAAVLPRIPNWWEQEIKAEEGIRICPNCTAVYFDKHWHNISALYNKLKDDLTIFRTECDACRMIGDHDYVGEVILSGFKDNDQKGELLKLIKNVGTRAMERDPQDRIISIEDTGKKIRITTTENQLAFSIGKQIGRAFKGGELEYHWSDKNKPLRVEWRYS